MIELLVDLGCTAAAFAAGAVWQWGRVRTAQTRAAAPDEGGRLW